MPSDPSDRALIQIVDAAVAEASRRSGDWLLCRPGCTQCCHAPFAITSLDAQRLADGLAEIAQSDAARVQRVRLRASAYIVEMGASAYPGDFATGELFDEDALPDSMDTAACPALDPESGCCDVYEFRPITCRTFGPPGWVTHVETGAESLAACELCYNGATDEQIAACAVDTDPDGIEAALLADLDSNGVRGATIVAFAVR